MIAINARASISWTRVHAIFIKTHAIKGTLSDGSNGSPGDAWRLPERQIFIGHAIMSYHTIFIGWLDGERPRTTIDVRSWPNPPAIVARLWRDCGSFIAKSGATIPPTDGPWSSCDRAHQNHLLTRLNGPELVRKSTFKKPMYPLFISQLLIESWRNKAIWKKDLEFFVIPPR